MFENFRSISFAKMLFSEQIWERKRKYSFTFVQRNWFLPQINFFLIPISLQPNSLNLRYFKLKVFYLTEFIFKSKKVYDIWLLRYMDGKPEFVSKTQFPLLIFKNNLNRNKKLWYYCSLFKPINLLWTIIYYNSIDNAFERNIVYA